MKQTSKWGVNGGEIVTTSNTHKHVADRETNAPEGDGQQIGDAHSSGTQQAQPT